MVSTRDTQGVAHELLVLERGRGTLVACANVTPRELPLPLEVGQLALILSTEDSSLVPGGGWEGAVGELALVLSTEDCVYGGQRTPETSPAQLAPYELAIFGSPEWRT